jgi:uncharacterized protein YjiS (DUF1127 family)
LSVQKNKPTCRITKRNLTHQRILDMAAYDTPQASLVSTGAIGRIGTLFTSIMAGLTAWNDARATRKALSGLSQRELDDIGLTRADVDRLTGF